MPGVGGRLGGQVTDDVGVGEDPGVAGDASGLVSTVRPATGHRGDVRSGVGGDLRDQQVAGGRARPGDRQSVTVVSLEAMPEPGTAIVPAAAASVTVTVTGGLGASAGVACGQGDRVGPRRAVGVRRVLRRTTRMPSPKFHSQDVGDPVEVSVNCTGSGACPAAPMR